MNRPVKGTQADGAVIANPSVPVAGIDHGTSVISTIAVDSSGYQAANVSGDTAAGQPAPNPVAIGGSDGGTLRAAHVDAAGDVQVDVLSSALPSGAATSALQGAGLPAALGAGGGVKVDGSGTALPISATALPPARGATSTVAAVASSAATQVILAANATRIGAIVQNDADKIAYVALAATSAVALYTIQIAVGGSWTLPVAYTGIISCIHAAGPTGNVLVTEVST